MANFFTGLDGKRIDASIFDNGLTQIVETEADLPDTTIEVVDRATGATEDVVINGVNGYVRETGDRYEVIGGNWVKIYRAGRYQVTTGGTQVKINNDNVIGARISVSMTAPDHLWIPLATFVGYEREIELDGLKRAGTTRVTFNTNSFPALNMPLSGLGTGDSVKLFYKVDHSESFDAFTDRTAAQQGYTELANILPTNTAQTQVQYYSEMFGGTGNVNSVSYDIEGVTIGSFVHVALFVEKTSTLGTLYFGRTGTNTANLNYTTFSGNGVTGLLIARE